MPGINAVFKLPSSKQNPKELATKMVGKDKISIGEVHESENFYVHIDFIDNSFTRKFESKDGSICAFVYGYVYFNSNDHLSNHENLDHADQLIELYKNESENITNLLSGDYIVIICDHLQRKQLIFNSHFGMIPIYYYLESDILLVSSKVENIVKSEIANFVSDEISIIESMAFNYILTDHTLVKNIFSFESAQLLQIDERKLTFKSYWNIEELFGKKTIRKKEAIDHIDSAFEKVLRTYTYPYFNKKQSIASSITGGWDGRLILSYFLKWKRTNDLVLYSFGGENAPDVKIPIDISNKFKLNYIPFYINDEYLTEKYPELSLESILNSSGQRTYATTHYLFALKELSKYANRVISGNCGSNILKFGKIVPGTVFPNYLFQLVSNGFDNEKIHEISLEIREKYSKIVPFNLDKLVYRLKALADQYKDLKNSSQIHFKVLLDRVERKYFGVEASSYEQYIINSSPFINKSFIEALSETHYWGANYKYNTNSLKFRKMQTEVYAKLIKRNSFELGGMMSDKGISVNDIFTIAGKIKLINNKFIKKKKKHSKRDWNNETYTDRFLNAASIQMIDMSGYNYLEETAYYSSSFFIEKMKNNHSNFN